MDSRDDTIEVTGTGEGSGTPDLVVVDLRIHAEQESVAAALHTISRVLRAVLDAARGSDPDLHPPQTIGLSVHPRHDHEGRSVVGFAAAQQIRFTVPSGERAGELISLVSEAAGDALAVDQLSLAITDPAPPLWQARDAAYAAALDKAQQLAALAGRVLGEVRAITESPAPLGGPFPRAEARAAPGARMVPVEPGEQTLTATVTVRWDLV
ncbi:hypothetical protein BH24ACT8_BH24ACT8_22220 [soil metagenome]|jgi:uncharacterized protein YggE